MEFLRPIYTNSGPTTFLANGNLNKIRTISDSQEVTFQCRIRMLVSSITISFIIKRKPVLIIAVYVLTKALHQTITRVYPLPSDLTFIILPLDYSIQEYLKAGPGHGRQFDCSITLLPPQTTQFIQQIHKTTAHDTTLFMPREWADGKYQHAVTVHCGLG